MHKKYFLAALSALWGFPVCAVAGAWPQNPGHTQIIASYEPAVATQAFDGDGQETIALIGWQQNDSSLFFDYGLGERLTLTTKLNFKNYKTEYTKFSGLGSVELGGRFTVHKDEDYVLAFGGSLEGLGKGRRNDFEAGGMPGTDVEMRVYFGKNIRLRGKAAFVDVQAARRIRQNDASQWRLDATLGVKTSSKWMVLAQAFAGQTDQARWGRAKWLNVQYSVVRSFGRTDATSLQLGVRETVVGQNIPHVHAVIISLWKNF